MGFSLRQSPSKFGKGVGLLWRGNNLKTLNSFIRKFITSRKIETDPNIFLFESARAALYNSLCASGIGKGDEVIISSYTCDAVTYGVKRTGAQVVYVDVNNDLTMRDDDVIKAIGSNTKAVVLQNTFGRLGLKIETIEKIKALNILVIEDCALAVGSIINDKALGEFGDITIWSLEASKTVTIGWGGVLLINNNIYLDKINKRYKEIGSVPLVLDFRRLFQLWFSVLMTKKRVPGSILIWYFLYGFRIFRKSNTFNINSSHKHEKIGKISNYLFYHMLPKLKDIFAITNRNYNKLLKEVVKLGLNCPVVEKDGEFIVTPRLPLLVKSDSIANITKEGFTRKVEVGHWFDNAPPHWGLSSSKIYSSQNASEISQKIINLPCHWTLSDKELEEVTSLIGYIARTQ